MDNFVFDCIMAACFHCATFLGSHFELLWQDSSVWLCACGTKLFFFFPWVRRTRRSWGR